MFGSKRLNNRRIVPNPSTRMRVIPQGILSRPRNQNVVSARLIAAPAAGEQLVTCAVLWCKNEFDRKTFRE